MHDATVLLWGGIGGAWIACAVVALILSRRHGFTQLFDIIVDIFGAPGAAAALLRLPNFPPVLGVEEIATMIAAVEAIPGPHVSIEDTFTSILTPEHLFLYKTGAAELIPFIEIYSARRLAVSIYLRDVFDTYMTRGKAYALLKGMKLND